MLMLCIFEIIVFKLGITICFNQASMTTIALYNYLMNKLICLTKIEITIFIDSKTQCININYYSIKEIN